MLAYRAKSLAFYEACLTGWVQTSFETDKSILAIASGVLTIMCGVIFQFSKDLALGPLMMFGLCALACVICVILCVAILWSNRKIFEANINGGTERSLGHLDAILFAAFIIAMGSMTAGGGWLLIPEVHKKINMNDKPAGPRVFVGDSASGMRHLAPQPPAPQPAPAAKPAPTVAAPTTQKKD